MGDAGREFTISGVITSDVEGRGPPFFSSFSFLSLLVISFPPFHFFSSFSFVSSFSFLYILSLYMIGPSRTAGEGEKRKGMREQDKRKRGEKEKQKEEGKSRRVYSFLLDFCESNFGWASFYANFTSSAHSAVPFFFFRYFLLSFSFLCSRQLSFSLLLLSPSFFSPVATDSPNPETERTSREF